MPLGRRRLSRIAVGLLYVALLGLLILSWHTMQRRADKLYITAVGSMDDGRTRVCDAGRWSRWSACDAMCFRQRRRLQAEYGQLLPLCEPVIQTQACPASLCSPDTSDAQDGHCRAPWSEWSPCSVTCGKGYRVRSRAPANDARDCILHDTQACVDLPPCPRITCESSHQLVDADDMYFAKGYSKTAWRGEYMGIPVVIKRPVERTDVHLRRFGSGMQAEIEWLEQLSPFSEHIMDYYGSCDADESPFSVVEGNLVKWSWVTEMDVSPCFRLRMAQQVTKIVSLLDQYQLFHCDWKYDQTALSFEGIVKLVDLKSLYSTETGNYKSDLACSSDSDCKRCLKMMDLEVDQSCDAAIGFCRGYNTHSLIFATAHSFWGDLIIGEEAQLLSSDEGRELYDHMSRLMEAMLAPKPDHRPTPDQVLQQLLSFETDVCGAQAGKKGISQWDRQLLQEAYITNMHASNTRCQKRYC